MRASARTEIRLDCDRKTAWQLVTDTNRLNREAGLAEVEYELLEGMGPARYKVRTWLGPFPAEFEELPFEWRELERWSVRRKVKRHLVKEIRAELSFFDGPAGTTRLDVAVDLDMSSPVFWPIGMAGARGTVRRLASAARRLTRGQRRGPAPRIDRAQLEKQREELASALPASRPLVDRLAELIENEDDAFVVHLRPYEIAARWGAGRAEVLDLFLTATERGLLELSFDLLCPGCRTATLRVPTLEEVKSHAQCALCDIGFEAELDRSVEASFRPPSAIRLVDEVRFCTGGPSRTPHIKWQVVLPPSGELELTAPEEEGRYRLCLRGGASLSLLVEAGAPTSGAVRIRADELSGDAQVAPGGTLRLSVETGGGDRHLKLEHLAFESTAATVYELSTRPGFRRRLSGLLLKPNTQLKVSRATLLFTDLRGSTAFYSKAGDAKAFRVVQDHFEILGQIIQRHEGTIVKTIGDAIMASFPSDRRGLEASLDLLGAFRDFLAGDAELSGLGLKLGLASGPCYAVTANGTLDFFGQTVNTAARIEGQAAADQLVVPASLLDELGAPNGPEGAEIVERFEVTPKGLIEPLRLVRLRLAR